MNNPNCIIVPDEHGNIYSIRDTVEPDGRTTFGRKNLEECRAENPRAEMVTLDEAVKRIEASTRTEPVLCAPDNATDALECLPPIVWTNHGDTESFFMGEALNGRMHHVFVRIGWHWFKFVEAVSTPHAELVRRVRESDEGKRVLGAMA